MKVYAAFAMLVVACGSTATTPNEREAKPMRAATPTAPEVRTGSSQQVLFRSPEDCSKADVGYADPDIDPNLPHQFDGFVGLFPSETVIADIVIGKHIMVLDRIAPPIHILQRIPVTPTTHVLDLRRGPDGACRLMPGHDGGPREGSASAAP